MGTFAQLTKTLSTLLLSQSNSATSFPSLVLLSSKCSRNYSISKHFLKSLEIQGSSSSSSCPMRFVGKGLNFQFRRISSVVSPAGSGLPKGLLPTVPSKKRVKRKGTTRPILENLETEPSLYPVVAYATCDELYLDRLRNGLVSQGLYQPTEWTDDSDSALSDVIHVTAKYPIGDEPREIFFFRDGMTVFWNISDMERTNVLKFLEDFESEKYDAIDVMHESEFLMYNHSDTEKTRLAHGRIQFSRDLGNILLEKYTIANAMALSVKLGIWESSLEKFVVGIDHVTDELKGAKPLRLTRAQVLQKTGELFALRNELNLNSDLLDTPDFYWEHENLEHLYHKMYTYLSINRRTGVMNEKLAQCCELLELISGHLNDKHHVRLEWMIIILITIEVAMEVLHIIERL